MHPQKWSKLHVVRHRSWHVVTPRRNPGTRSRVRINNPAVTINHQTEIGGNMVHVLFYDMESPNRSSPALFARSNGRNQSDSAVLKQISRLLSQVNNNCGVLRMQLRSRPKDN